MINYETKGIAGVISMKCTKCNNEIQNGAAFCSCCGAAVENQDSIKKISLKCEQCNGTLTIDSDKTVLECPYCGYQTLIIENDAVKIERIKTSAHKEIEMEKIKSNDRLHQMENEKEQRQEENAQVEKFKKGIFAKFLIVAFLLSAVLTYFYFSSGRILTGILSLVQAVCFGSAWCLGMNIIKEKKRYIHILVAIVGIVLIVPTVHSCGSVESVSNKEVEIIQWNILDMGDMIPEPKSNKIDIYTNNSEWLNIDVYDMTEGDCYEYIQKCEDDYGFNIDVEKIGSSFWAYNEDGYELHVSYLTDYMGIDLKCPTEFGEYELPDYAINEGLPLPKSELGHYEWKYDDNFNIRIGDTTFEEYRDYVELCIAAGFTEDNQDGNDFYNGDNKDGFELSVNYLGNNIMSIDFDSPEGFESSNSNIELETKEEPKKESESTQEPEPIKMSTKESKSIQGLETPVAPFSEYEKAYIRKMSNYSLYIMFDEDGKKVVSFSTNDTYVMKGTYSGSFSSGVTISWDDGWNEKFKHSSGNVATLTDGNGYDWDYKVCEVYDAQEVLDDLK